MLYNDIFFFGVEAEIPPGIPQRPFCVAETVETVTGIRIMPIIEKIIVEQSAPHQTAVINLDIPGSGQLQTGISHGYGVIKAADGTVLDKELFSLHLRR